LVEWVDQKAVDYIREAKYRFFSPAIALNSKDPVSGKSIGPVLTSGALTNKPFLDGMEPLQASQSQSQSQSLTNQYLSQSIIQTKSESKTGIAILFIFISNKFCSYLESF
jgi:phage I-like protein